MTSRQTQIERRREQSLANDAPVAARPPKDRAISETDRLEEIARRRAAAQGLAGPRDRSPAALVRRFGAVQAQDYFSARWAIAQRLANDVFLVEAAVAA